MNNTKENFDKRALEIENYFSFVVVFNSDETKLSYKKDNNVITENIPSLFNNILIANSFLILYNLIESTIRNSVGAIYDVIDEEEIHYEELSLNLRNIWIRQSTASLKENESTGKILQEYIANLANNIINKDIVTLSKNKLDFSGNLDAQKIRELAKKIGFNESKNGRHLEQIKEKRNRLAHGEQTFYEVGKDFSIKEILEFKNGTIKHLSDVISNVEKFISDKGYRNS